MSLRDAVQVIAEGMVEEHRLLDEKEGDVWEKVGQEALFHLKSFAKQLQMALKASEGESSLRSLLVPPEVQHRSMIDQERERIRRERQERESDIPGAEELQIVSVHGGPAAGDDGIPTVLSIPAKMPIGAYTRVAGATYQLRPGGLHFVPEEKK